MSSTSNGPASLDLSPKAEQILAAARQVFLEHGFGATTTDMIQQAAGVSKSTVYAHFQGKDDLFVAVIRAECQRILERTNTEQLKGQTVRQALTQVGTRLLEVALAPSALALYRIVVAETPRFPNIGKVFHAVGPTLLREELARYLAAADKRGEVRVKVPDTAARQFVSMVLSDIQLQCLLDITPPPSRARVRKIVGAAVETFMSAYAEGSP